MTKNDLIEYADLLRDRVRNNRFRELDDQFDNDAAVQKFLDGLSDEPSERVVVG